MRKYLSRNGVARVLSVSQSRIRDLQRQRLLIPAAQADSGNGRAVWLFSPDHVEALRQQRMKAQTLGQQR